MKINLLINANNYRDHYLNIGPFISDNVTPRNVDDLSEFVDDGEAEEILALDVIDHLEPARLDGIMKNWISKLSHGGKLVIGGIDLSATTRLFVRGEIDIQAVHSLLYAGRKTTYTGAFIKQYLSSLGLQVVGVKNDNLSYVITAMRP